MGNVTHCINGPELARRLNKAMGKRASERASLETFSSTLRPESENIERLLDETGSSFEWLRHFQTALLGERLVLVATGWTRGGEYDGVWAWERSQKSAETLLLKGLDKAAASDILNDRIIDLDRSASLRLRPLRNAPDVGVPLLTGLVPDEHWSQDFYSRREHDSSNPFPYHGK